MSNFKKKFENLITHKELESLLDDMLKLMKFCFKLEFKLFSYFSVMYGIYFSVGAAIAENKIDGSGTEFFSKHIQWILNLKPSDYAYKVADFIINCNFYFLIIFILLILTLSISRTIKYRKYEQIN